MVLDNLLKIKKEFKKLQKKQNKKKTGDTIYIYRNEVDKACFQHDKA